MDADVQNRVSETEHLMNVVVEMRKIHGTACIEHSKKSSKIELELFHHALEVVSKSNFKSKVVPKIDVEKHVKELKEFDSQVNMYCKRTDDLQDRTKNVKMVLKQMQGANPVLGLRKPLTANMLLVRAKNKNMERASHLTECYPKR